MSINLDFINGYLNAMAAINTYANHGADYSFTKLSDKGNSFECVKDYFEGNDGLNWHVSFKQINRTEFCTVVEQWFFMAEHLSKMDKHHIIWTRDEFLEALIPIYLHQSDLYQVLTEPPVFYENIWDDLLILHHNQRYLLHFGMSD